MGQADLSTPPTASVCCHILFDEPHETLMLKAFAAVLGTFAFLWAALHIWDKYTKSGQIDHCLDAGRRWDHALKKCDGARPSYDGP
jgi:hypothetical protein